MALNFCSNCGAKLRAGAKFCGSCGQKIQSTETTKLPPMPYVKQKSVEELYAEKKAAAAQSQAAAPVNLEKDSPATQTAPKSVAEIFAAQKKNAQVQATSVPRMKKSPPPQVPPPSLTYTPPYGEDMTIKEKFFSTERRLDRSRHLSRAIGVTVVFLVLAVMALAVSERNDGLGAILLLAIYIAFLVTQYCLAVRRLKEMNKDSATGLALLVVLFAPLSLAFLAFPGTVGSNKYGADPLETERQFNR